MCLSSFTTIFIKIFHVKCFFDTFSFFSIPDISTMWQYLPGITPPKHKLTTEERGGEINLMRRHTTGFLSSWKSGRPWLRVETNTSDEEIMFCDFCIKADISSDKTSFINGCKSLNLGIFKKPLGQTTSTYLLLTNM